MDDLWSIERRLWLDGAGAYQGLMARECLMAFGPMGVMRNHDIVEALRDAPRWTKVRMSDQILVEPAKDVAVIAYRADGERDGSPAYSALCTSTYVRDTDGWKIAQHQQTPL